MSEICIVGAGVAGCHLGRRLAETGMTVSLLDPRAPWEKPCGGGLTAKVWRDFPEILEMGLETHKVDELIVVSPSGRRAHIDIDGRIKTVSRYELGKALLDRAVHAGVEFMPERVKTLSRDGSGWTVTTGRSEHRADFIVGADGATGIVRRNVTERFRRQDMLTTYGYLIQTKPNLPVIIAFSDEYQGYSWIFPRPGGCSAGIATQSDWADKDQLVGILDRFVEAEFEIAGLPKPDLARPYAAALPAMYQETFYSSKPGGDDWALVGDASGSADPATGEGIYWALKSADLLADSIIEDGAKTFSERWLTMARPDIARAAHMRLTLYEPRYLRLLGLFMMYSPFSRDIARQMIDGTQDYWTLKRRIALHLPQVFGEVLVNKLLGRKGDRT